jgi:glycosyltransferase involved in cell wall biosynthesis
MHDAIFRGNGGDNGSSATQPDFASMKLLSIVTVSLNAAATIERTLASVALQQLNFGVEHICVDGGSSDHTRTLIDRWASGDPRILRVYEPDTGIFDAMNKGLRMAQGEYVLFLNADDFLVAPDALARALTGCAHGGADNPDLIVGDAVMGRVGQVGFWRHRRVPRLLGRLRGFGMYPVHQAQFSKRRLLEAVGGFDARLRLAADINQYYDLERLVRPSIRLVGADLAFMEAGGAANAGLRAVCLGSFEIYRHLSAEVGGVKAAFMVLTKTLQSISEIRFGRCPHRCWFTPNHDSGGGTAK